MPTPSMIARHFDLIARDRAIGSARSAADRYANMAMAAQEQSLENDAIAGVNRARWIALEQILFELAERYPHDPLFAKTGETEERTSPKERRVNIMAFHRRASLLVDKILTGNPNKKVPSTLAWMRKYACF